jgi:hypothetical protein
LLPHVHIQLRDGRECTVTIGELRIVGRIDRREIREELRWITEHRAELHGAWRRLNP